MQPYILLLDYVSFSAEPETSALIIGNIQTAHLKMLLFILVSISD